MKKLLIAIGTSGLLFLNSCGPMPQDAVEYSDKITLQQNLIVVKEEGFLLALDEQPEKLKAAYDSLLAQVKIGITKTDNIGPFDGTREFLDASLNLLKLYQTVVENEYKVMAEIAGKPEGEYTEEDSDKFNSAMNDADQKLKQANEEAKTAQEKFAEKWGFEIDPNKKVLEEK